MAMISSARHSRNWWLATFFALVIASFLSAFQASAFAIGPSGGRRATQADQPSLDGDDALDDSPPSLSEARLQIVQITDVYTLQTFPSLKTMLAEKRAQARPGTKVVSVLTGDFLAPYLLSSVDKGQGMMNAIAKTPIDYLTWGNHEADVDHRTVCRHVRNYPGTWINSNMQDHEAMDAQVPFEVIEIQSEDGTNSRRIGFVAVLSDDPDLYSHFKAPGAFGGANIDDPWECLEYYKELLEGPEYQCDLVIPLQHTYVPDDEKTCHRFDFPVLLSGHDHHRVDEFVDGTRILKPGLDGIYATVLNLSWEDSSTPKQAPRIRANFAKVDNWEADKELEIECDRAYDALMPLRNTELARIPPTFEPLSSQNARGAVTTMGRLICTLLRSSLNTKRRQRDNRVDAVILMGGNIRGGEAYEEGSFFSLEMLEAEIKSDEVVGIVEIPGSVLAEGIAATHAGDPIPGWFQFDDGIHEVYPDDGGPPEVMAVGWEPIDYDRMYRVATKVSDLTNGQSASFTEYFTNHPEALPAKGKYVNIHAELMGYFARNLWRKLWEQIGPPRPEGGDRSEVDALCSMDCDPEERLEKLDYDHDGEVSTDDIHKALKGVLRLSVDDKEKSLAEFIHNFADTSGSGHVTVEDFQIFCNEMDELYEQDKWRLSWPRAARAFTPMTEQEEEQNSNSDSDVKVEAS